MAKTYNNPYTLDGLYKFHPGVSKAKIRATKALIESAMQGDHIALGKVQEAMTTSDMPFNFAQLTNLAFYEQFDAAERTWNQIAGDRVSPTLDKVRLYSLKLDWDEGTLGDGDPEFVSPNISEGSAYPYAYVSGEEGQGAGIKKAGFKTDFTFEAFHSDPLGFIQALPGLMLDAALNREEYDVYSALTGGVGASQQLQAATIAETGETVVANAPLSRESLIAAIQQLKNREFNGRKIQISGRIRVVVPIGRGDYVKFITNSLIPVTVDDGPIRYNVSGYSPLAELDVVESEYVTGSNWYLIPAPGTVRRPVLEHLTWSVQRAPELRVSNVTGNYVGGGVVDPFEGSFENDSITFRIRQYGGAILWTPNAVLWSTGAGS